MADEKKVLIDVEIKSSNATKNIVELKNQVADLKAEQYKLQLQNKNTAEGDVIYAEKIKALNAQIRENSKEVQSNVKAAKEQEGSLQQLKSQLSLLTAEYNKLSKEQRNSAAGVEMRNSIKGISDELKEAEGSVGNFSRNVGDYENKIKSALGLNTGFAGSLTEMTTATGGVTGGLKAAGAGVKAFGTQLLTLLANPIVATIAAIAATVMLFVGVFKKAYDVIQGNEEQSNRLSAALATLKPIGDAVTRIFESLGDVLITVAEGFGKVVGWMSDLIGAGEEVNATTQTYIDLEKERQQLLIDNRKNNEAASKTELEIAQLRNKIAEKDKYDAQQRIDFVNQAIAKELELGENKRILAERNLARLQIEDPLTKNSIEFQNELSQAIIAVNNATADAINSTKRLVAARATAVEEIRNENKAAEAKGIADAKAAADKRLEIATKLRQAENQLLNLKKETELNTLNEIASNAKLSDSERLSALIKLEGERKALLQANAAYQLSNAKLTNAERLVIEQKLSNDLIALENTTDKAIEAIDKTAEKKRIDEQIAAMNFETEMQKQVYEQQIAGKIRTNEEVHLQELLRIEADRKAQVAALELRLTVEPEKEAEIKRAIALIDAKADTDTAKQNADFRKKESDLKLQAERMDAANALDAVKGNISKEHELLLAGLEADRLAEIEAAKKTGADVALINAKYAAKEKALNDETRNLKIDNALKVAKAVADAASGINDFLNALGEREIRDYENKNKEKNAKLDEQLKQGLISQQQHDYEVAKSAYELDVKRDKLEREAAIRAKALAIVMATINTASAIVAALATPLIGPALAIAAGIAGAAQIAAIIATPLPAGGAGTPPRYEDFATTSTSSTGKATVDNSAKELEKQQRELEKVSDAAQKLSEKAQSEYEKAIEKAEKAVQDAQDLRDKFAQEAQDRSDKAIMDAWDKSDRAIAEASKRADDISQQAQRSLAEALSNFEKAQAAVISIQAKIDKKAADKLTAEENARVKLLEAAEKIAIDAGNKAQQEADKANELAVKAEENYQMLLSGAVNYGNDLWYRPDLKAAKRKQEEQIENARISAENARIAAETTKAVQESAIVAAQQATLAAEERAKMAAEAAQRASDAEDIELQRQLAQAQQAEIDAQSAIEQAKLDAELALQAAETAAKLKEDAELAAEERKRLYDEQMEERRRLANEAAQEKADKAVLDTQEAANNAQQAAAMAYEAAATAAAALAIFTSQQIPTVSPGFRLPDTVGFRNDGGFAGRNTGGALTRDSIRDAMVEAVAQVQVIATIEDIQKEEKNYMEIKNRSIY